MISRKNLDSAEMDTLTKSCSPTTVTTANGEVQTHEEVTVYVKNLDIFLSMKVLENTPAVLSLGMLCDEHGHSYEWINGQKPHLIQKRYSDTVQHGELRYFALWFQVCQVRPLDLHQLQGHFRDRRAILHHLLPPRLLHLQQVKFRLENEKMELTLISPVQVSTSVDDRSGRPDKTQANNITKIKRRPR